MTAVLLMTGIGNAQEQVKLAPLKASFHVAPHGNDSNPGTATAPFATMVGARNAVRAQIAAGLEHDVLVLIRAGVYSQTETLTFGPADSGNGTHTVTYAAYPGEKVVLSGGRPVTGWKKGAGEIWTTEIPEAKAGAWQFRQLFVNGDRVVRARTPNGSAPINWWYLTNATFTDLHDGSTPYYTLSVDHHIGAWSNPADIEIVYMYNDDGTRRFLGSVNETNQTFTFPVPGAYTVWTSGCMVDPPLNQSCFFENALEMLDEPGEWYLDKKTGVLSYWPRPGEDLTTAQVIAPVVQNTLLSITGASNNPVINLRFNGIHIEHVDRPLPGYGQMKLFCSTQFTTTQTGPEHGFLEAAVEFKYARSCHFTDGGISHVGGYGLCLRKGTAYDVIEGNEIGGVGAGGIGVGEIRQAPWDAWSWNSSPGPNDYKGFRIANNSIHHCGLDYIGGPGICMGTLQESVIAHNLIHDISYSGIQFAGDSDKTKQFSKNNTIESNHIYRAMKTAVDGGGIYITFAHAGQSIVRGNLIHDMLWNPYARGNILNGIHDMKACHGLYLDGNCSGCRFENNVVYQNAGGPLLFNAATTDNAWVDNLFEKEGTPPQQFIEAIQACAGLEPAYRKSLLQQDPQPCLYSVLTDPAAARGWAAYQFHLSVSNRGVVQIVRRADCNAESITVKFRGLDAGASYAMKGYVGKLAKADTAYNDGIWFGKSDKKLAAHYIEVLADIPILSGHAKTPLSDLGIAVDGGKASMAGKQLLDDGLTLRIGKSPEVIWIDYRQAK